MSQCAHCGQPIPEEPTPVQIIATEYPSLPISEMFARGWLGDETTVQGADDLRRRLIRFFRVGTETEMRQLLSGR